jgi:ABC-type multidrug transport system ATPase subunit
MNSVSKKIRVEILKNLLENENFTNLFPNGNSIVDFLDALLNLRSLSSTDDRFDNAYDDSYQHLVNNDDWSLEYVLLDRFNIINDEELFLKFIETIIHPNFAGGEDVIMGLYLHLNPYFQKEGLTLVISDYWENGLPVYELVEEKNISDLPIGLKTNKIPFFVENQPSGRSDIQTNHETPKEFPSFVLVFNSTWNDYSIESEYDLFYYSDSNSAKHIGELKIIHEQNEITPEVLDGEFLFLNESFCSLGQEYKYYSNLKEIFGKEFQSVLWALRDAAFFTDIQEKFERKKQYRKSLIRYDVSERLVREAKYRIYNYNLKNLYNFTYSFKPKFSSETIDVNFDFESFKTIPNRIYALIGKNGAGKTQLITTLPNDIFKKNNESFLPKTPLFSKVIAVSYSVFDNFEIPKKTADFNYVYCGLEDDRGELSPKGLKLRFHASWKKIKSQDRFNKWVKLLENFIEGNLIEKFIDYEKDEVSISGFNEINNMLSSGQSITLYIITEIVANIRYDSLLIYDEPETHLHPNAISQLINTIYDLVVEFESFCIIATHSPLIIREIQSENVLVMERDDEVLSIRKPGVETLGENLTIITEEVFGNREIPKNFKKLLEKAHENRTYDQAIELLESDNIPLSLNARIYLKSISNDKS